MRHLEESMTPPWHRMTATYDGVARPSLPKISTLSATIELPGVKQIYQRGSNRNHAATDELERTHQSITAVMITRMRLNWTTNERPPQPDAFSNCFRRSRCHGLAFKGEDRLLTNASCRHLFFRYTFYVHIKLGVFGRRRGVRGQGV